MAVKRSLLLFFFAAWFLWFIVSLASGGYGVWVDISKRGVLAYHATVGLFEAIGRAVFYWINFTAPFAVDVGNLLKNANNKLDWPKRILIIGIALSILIVQVAVKGFLYHKQNVKRVAFQCSIIVFAPALYVVLGRLPNPEMWASGILQLITSVVPCVLSTRSFWARDKEGCGRWLRYWVVFPVVETARNLATIYGVDKEGGDAVLRALIIFTVWLQIWDGSLTFYGMYNAMCVWFLKKLPYRAFHSRAWKTPGTNMITSFLQLSAHRVLATILLVVMAMVLVYVFYSFVTTVVPLMLMWGASLNAAEVVIQRIEELYEQNLAFWVLSEGTTVTLSHIPVVGTLFGLFRIPILVWYYMFGNSILRFVGKAIGLNSLRTDDGETHEA
mmetsp:Transcript_36970/g.68234  ORF Transcript_36970/g.68234 Transcript_36970/m.68234 type:complete len:386 (-) Transcript_36970:287-1444(-)|eukprot:CAMPEP_0170177418 /NCGR_PEP_ID=MMETSP0040_2-20121228/10073_1 /TAXON_ID=641309 /ORGANISM="Lotharella oceanica, Strain CCMP622" /LENGTH=385 /DNA_ID=CAMNT_0010420051 /DNA_START=53 /DNA_END=1210 /DNA_ORIENTATION=+